MGWDFGTLYQGFGVFSAGLAPINQGDANAGFIDKTGRIRIPLRFKRTLGFSEGFTAVQLESGWGYIDTTGALVIQAQFSDATSFVDGLALVKTGAFWSYIDMHGSVVLGDVFKNSE